MLFRIKNPCHSASTLFCTDGGAERGLSCSSERGRVVEVEIFESPFGSAQVFKSGPNSAANGEAHFARSFFKVFAQERISDRFGEKWIMTFHRMWKRSLMSCIQQRTVDKNAFFNGE